MIAKKYNNKFGPGVKTFIRLTIYKVFIVPAHLKSDNYPGKTDNHTH